MIGSNYKGLLAFLKAQGYTSNINEGMYNYLVASGYTGQLNEMLYSFLTDLGYTQKTLPEKFIAWQTASYAVDPYSDYTAAYDFANEEGTTLSGSEILTAPNLGNGGTGYDLAAFSAATRPSLVSDQAVCAVGRPLVNMGGDFGPLIRTHTFQLMFDGVVNNVSNSPIIVAANPATGNGRFIIQALTDRLRIQERNSANSTIAQLDLTGIVITNGTPFVLSISRESNLIWVDYGTGGTTTRYADGSAFNASAQNVSFVNVGIGALIINGAVSGVQQAALDINALNITSLA